MSPATATAGNPVQGRRVCSSKDCGATLSRYNGEDLCGACEERKRRVDLEATVELEREREVQGSRPADLCPRGHDKEVAGRTVAGACGACNRLRSRAASMKRHSERVLRELPQAAQVARMSNEDLFDALLRGVL